MALLHSQWLQDMRGQQDSRIRATETGQESQSQRSATRRSRHPLSLLPDNFQNTESAISTPADRSSPWRTDAVLVASRRKQNTSCEFFLLLVFRQLQLRSFLHLLCLPALRELSLFLATVSALMWPLLADFPITLLVADKWIRSFNIALPRRRHYRQRQTTDISRSRAVYGRDRGFITRVIDVADS